MREEREPLAASPTPLGGRRVLAPPPPTGSKEEQGLQGLVVAAMV
jgi:hypothetical protein